MPNIILVDAEPDDIEILVHYSSTMNEEDGHPASPHTKQAILNLIHNPEWGMVKLIQLNDMIIGSLCVSYGYSIEYGGRDVALDELYIEPEYRQNGYGRQAIELIEQELNQGDFVAFYLAVTPINPAKRLYSRLNFKPMGYEFMVKLFNKS